MFDFRSLPCYRNLEALVKETHLLNSAYDKLEKVSRIIRNPIPHAYACTTFVKTEYIDSTISRLRTGVESRIKAANSYIYDNSSGVFVYGEGCLSSYVERAHGLISRVRTSESKLSMGYDKITSAITPIFDRVGRLSSTISDKVDVTGRLASVVDTTCVVVNQSLSATSNLIKYVGNIKYAPRHFVVQAYENGTLYYIMLNNILQTRVLPRIRSYSQVGQYGVSHYQDYFSGTQKKIKESANSLVQSSFMYSNRLFDSASQAVKKRFTFISDEFHLFLGESFQDMMDGLVFDFPVDGFSHITEDMCDFETTDSFFFEHQLPPFVATAQDRSQSAHFHRRTNAPDEDKTHRSKKGRKRRSS